MVNTIAETLSAIKNAEKKNKKVVVRRSPSQLLMDVLKVAMHEGYIGELNFTADSRGGELVINLNGKINNVGIISPHFSVGYRDMEKYEKRFLPARDFGRLILTTPAGVMTHIDAKKKKQGGKLLAFVY